MATRPKASRTAQTRNPDHVAREALCRVLATMVDKNLTSWDSVVRVLRAVSEPGVSSSSGASQKFCRAFLDIPEIAAWLQNLAK